MFEGYQTDSWARAKRTHFISKCADMVDLDIRDVEILTNCVVLAFCDGNFMMEDIEGRKFFCKADGTEVTYHDFVLNARKDEGEVNYEHAMIYLMPAIS